MAIEPTEPRQIKYQFWPMNSNRIIFSFIWIDVPISILDEKENVERERKKIWGKIGDKKNAIVIIHMVMKFEMPIRSICWPPNTKHSMLFEQKRIISKNDKKCFFERSKNTLKILYRILSHFVFICHGHPSYVIFQ